MNICPNCGKSTALRDSNPEEYKKRKIQNAKNSSMKAKLNGNKPGPKKSRDDDEIKRLREKGFSIRKIAKLVGFSTSLVWRSLKP